MVNLEEKTNEELEYTLYQLRVEHEAVKSRILSIVDKELSVLENMFATVDKELKKRGATIK